ncbi:MAG: hypothetical protein V4629_08845 [Pseudomonadota bacterium]
MKNWLKGVSTSIWANVFVFGMLVSPQALTEETPPVAAEKWLYENTQQVNEPKLEPKPAVRNAATQSVPNTIDELPLFDSQPSDVQPAPIGDDAPSTIPAVQPITVAPKKMQAYFILPIPKQGETAVAVWIMNAKDDGRFLVVGKNKKAQPEAYLEVPNHQQKVASRQLFNVIAAKNHFRIEHPDSGYLIGSNPRAMFPKVFMGPSIDASEFPLSEPHMSRWLFLDIGKEGTFLIKSYYQKDRCLDITSKQSLKLKACDSSRPSQRWSLVRGEGSRNTQLPNL